MYIPPFVPLQAPTIPQYQFFTGPNAGADYQNALAQYNTALASYQAAQASTYGAQVQSGTALEQAFLASQDSALERQARLTEAGLGQNNALALSAQNNAAQLAQLQAQITATGGQATQTQAAELTRLQAQLASQSALQTGAQTFGASESAAERAARAAELTQASTAAQALESLRNTGAMGLGAQTNAADLERLKLQIAATGGQATDAQAA